jgi:hypothetical protein
VDTGILRPMSHIFLKIATNFYTCRSSCGYEMLVCSSDGTVAFFQFEKHEMGDPMSVDDKVCHTVH